MYFVEAAAAPSTASTDSVTATATSAPAAAQPVVPGMSAVAATTSAMLPAAQPALTAMPVAAAPMVAGMVYPQAYPAGYQTAYRPGNVNHNYLKKKRQSVIAACILRHVISKNCSLKMLDILYKVFYDFLCSCSWLCTVPSWDEAWLQCYLRSTRCSLFSHSINVSG